MAGLHCPACQAERSFTIDSRAIERWRYRRRRCASCDHRWTTVELTYTGRLKEVLWVKVKETRVSSSGFR